MKLILENKTKLPDHIAYTACMQVVEAGYTSRDNTQYAIGSTFEYDGIQYTIWSDKNKSSDKLTIVEL